MQLRSVVGMVKLQVWHGKDPQEQRWGCPIRERWGLSAHQECSLALEDKLAFTVTATGTYEQAAAVATKWGCPTDDATLHALVQRLGRRAEVQTQARLATVAQEAEPQRGATELAVLMLDGVLVRERGPGWGKKKTAEARVEWHELKLGLFYRQEQASQTAGGRGLLAEKVVVSWQGEPLELGQRLHWEAQRRGLGRAKETLALGDGAVWIWNTVADRWPQAHQLLDFYHGSEHLWELGRAVRGEATAAPWVEGRLHRLRHGKEAALLREIGQLRAGAGELGETVRREQNYFAGQAARMHYAQIAARGWPIGSGPVESACRQQQCRFKRPGQFWTKLGVRHLRALQEARDLGHWDELWSRN